MSEEGRMTELLEWQRRGKTFIGTPQQFIDELTYHSYRSNRRQHPERVPSTLADVFPHWERFEQRYQAELTRCPQ